jgi:hypothetical protein
VIERGQYRLDPVAFSTWSSREEFEAVNHEAITSKDAVTITVMQREGGVMLSRQMIATLDGSTQQLRATNEPENQMNDI